MANVADAKEIVSDLNNLIELDYDAIAAYQAAIERLETDAYKMKLTEFLGDHERHTVELGKLVAGEGGKPSSEGDAKKFLTKGKVVMADLAGDEAILKAMKSNEEQTNSKYEDAVEQGYPENIQKVLQRGLADERRHKAWLIDILDDR
ncbi:MAG: DUF2383 domain-containing protein [Pseudohongiellaceae bacterium]